MGKKGRGLVKKRQQATEMHNPTKSGLTGIRMQFQKNMFLSFTILIKSIIYIYAVLMVEKEVNNLSMF